MSLAEARDSASQAKTLHRNGQDPGLVKKLQKREKLLVAENHFEAIALEWWVQKKGGWSVAHAERVLGSLKQDVFPYLGHRSITEIQPPDVLEVIRKVENRDALDVASRILQRCTAIFRYAVQTGRAQINPASELKGVLKTRKVQHRAAATRAELPELLQAVSGYEGQLITRIALQVLILTFVRPGELRKAKWSEFDLEAKVWRIPAERMKMGTEHLVPLSRQVLALLEALRPVSGTMTCCSLANAVA